VQCASQRSLPHLTEKVQLRRTTTRCCYVFVALLLATCTAEADASTSAPSSLVVEAAGETWLSLRWTEGALDPNCTFRAWELQLRARDSLHWSSLTANCSEVVARTETTCNVTDLQQNTEYEVQVREACTDPLLNSVFTHAALRPWTLPGTWEVYIGTHPTVSLTLELASPPFHCHVQKECCGDQFSVCFSGPQNKTATISRTDTSGGWGQRIRLICTAMAVRDFVPAPQEARAAPPRIFELSQEAITTTHANYATNWAFGGTTCSCAFFPHSTTLGPVLPVVRCT